MTGVTVLFTGIGLDGGPDIIRGLRADKALAARVVGVDVNPVQASRHLCDVFHVVPRRDDPAYLTAVVALAHREGAKVVYPLPTFDQELFAAARTGLEAEGFAVPVCPPEAVRICNDKWLLYEETGRFNASLVPRTIRVTSAAELKAAAESLGYPGRRVCIRRRVSRGAIGFRVLDAGHTRLEALLSLNPGSPLLSLAEVLDTLSHAQEFPEYLVQEYLPGDEWDVDVLCRRGDALIVAARKNLAMTGGGAIDSILERCESVAGPSRELVRRLGLDALVNISFKQDAAGVPKLIEINPRIPSSILCALGGGVNLVALAVRQALGETITAAEPKPGGRFLRYAASAVLDPAGAPVIC